MEEQILGWVGSMTRSSSQTCPTSCQPPAHAEGSSRPAAGDSPVPHHVDSLDAGGFGDLDNGLAHAAVGSVLDDGVTWI